ncbi:MAG TPA: diacylglycerol kinase family protein [Acidimicrobiia bacterium]
MSSARRRQLVAILALVAFAATLVLVLFSIKRHPGQLVVAWLVLLLASAAGWVALTRTGVTRVIAAVVSVAALAGAIALLLLDAAFVDVVIIVVVSLLATACSRYAVGVDRAMLRAAEPPGRPVPKAQRPVLLMNPRSGGGKVEQFDLVHEAERRGIEPIVLQPGDDLAALAREAVARGADVLGMAGGDGSQALVAGIASKHGVPFVCIPAGTRNHLALDLGVDREDVVGSLDAYTDGYERTVDLATVNGDVFVNNVSLGVYARIVQSEEYRDAKMQTAASMLPELLGRDTYAFDFSVERPDGTSVDGPCLVLVSNNVYELARLGGFGSRARLDAGVLGVVTLRVANAADVAALAALETAGHVDRARGWEAWSAKAVEVRSGQPIAAGVDGEARTYDAPLRFEARPAALSVRVARSAPGVSPAHVAGHLRHARFSTLLRVAAGREVRI